MQTAINPALAAAMTLEQAAQMGEFSPVTKDGTPTVVGRNLQQALQPMMPQGMPGMQTSMPGVQNVAQQAGLAGQIQAMQQQQAQQAMMQQAMRQAQPPAGIEGLNPQMGNFAEGGIVGTVPGYAGGGSSYADFLRRRREEKERQRSEETFFDVSPSGEIQSYRQDPEIAREMLAANTPMMPIPEIEIAPQQATPRVAAPNMAGAPAASGAPRAAAPTGVEALFGQERAEYAKIKGPATAQEILAREQMDRPTYEQFLRSRGIDPDMLTKRGEEDKALIEQQRALLRERMAREQEGDTTLSRVGAALRGFRQMKGQGIGDAVAGAHDNLARQLQAGQIRMDQFRDAELRLNELEITRRRALDDARRATAEGDWNRASQALTTERNAANEILKLTAPTFGRQATAMVQERQAQEAGAARRADQDRINELYRLRLNTLTGGKPPTDEQKMEAMEYALQAVKGAAGMARKPSPQEMRQRMLEQYADNWEKMDLMEKNQLLKQGIKTYEEYVKYRDRIAGVAPTGGGSSSGQVLRFDERGNLIK